MLVSKVSLLLNLLSRKWFYAELMTFLVSLAMGTMYCITIFQFIPESLGEMFKISASVKKQTLSNKYILEFHIEHILPINIPCNSNETILNLPTLVKSQCTKTCVEGKDKIQL